MIRLYFIFLITIVICCGIALTASATNNERECLKWKPESPTPTPIPITTFYTEWIPYPGKAIDSGYGWIRASDFVKAAKEWPPKNLQVHIMTDTEYNQIAEEYGLPMTHGGKWTYGFAPVQGFPTAMGGVVLKNTWLPLRLQQLVNK